MADAPSKLPTTTSNPVFIVLKQLKELWDNQPKGRRSLAVVTLVGVLGFVGITTFLHKVESFTPVAEGLSPSDTQAVYSAVLARGLNARLRDGKVEVEDSDLASAKAIAAVSAGASGLSSMSDQFDGQHLGRSSFDEQVAFKRALEGELARNIIALAQVTSANVHIAFGKRSAIKDMESAATASVTLVLRPGQTLTNDQVSGIRSLVAASVDNLDASKVVVIGPRGPLDGTEKAGTKGPQDLEARIADRTRSLIEKIVGVGHVSVVATAEMDTRKIESTEDLYDKDSSALLSESVTVDGNDPTSGQSSVGGIAGAQGNLPGAAAPTSGSGAGSAANGHKAQTRNFNNSHKQTHVENPEQTIKKLHVAVLVDEGKDKSGKPAARTKEELDRITVLTHNAAGIDDARGDTLEVASVPFAPIEIPSEPEVPKPLLPVPMPVAIGGGAGVLVLLAMVVLFLRRGKKSKSQALVLKGGNRLSFPTPVAELERVLDNQPALGSKEALGLPSGRTAQERVMDVVRSDVDRAAGVLTGWLAEVPALAKGATK